MTFGVSIKTVFSKYADFTGRATRSEYWWFVLFTFLVRLLISAVSETIGELFYYPYSFLQSIWVEDACMTPIAAAGGN